MVRFAIPPRFEIAFEGDPDPSFRLEPEPLATDHIERRKTWEALSPSTRMSFKLEILNRGEVAELVRSIARTEAK